MIVQLKPITTFRSRGKEHVPEVNFVEHHEAPGLDTSVRVPINAKGKENWGNAIFITPSGRVDMGLTTLPPVRA
ncbi:MAG: hypothetical protein UU09_C0007G0010 [Microgenomates group bacterium GW2011_GWA2_40_6]|nr:MAG: hypothetical protein UU09_C0007G0010 [Microgenomates group bacterium GW2011_GWA2_40_6]